MDKVFGGVVGVLLGVYLVRVGIAGNGKQLLALLREDDKYLDFLLALWILWVLHEYGPTHDITDQLVISGIVGTILLVVHNNPQIFSNLELFGEGKIGLADLFKQTAQSAVGAK